MDYPILVSASAFTDSLDSPVVGAGVEPRAVTKEEDGGEKEGVAPPSSLLKVPTAGEREKIGSSWAGGGMTSSS